MTSKNKVFASISALVLVLGFTAFALADGEWIRTGQVWFKNKIKVGSAGSTLVDASGNVTVPGTLGIVGAVSLTGALGITGDLTLRDDLIIADLAAGVTAAVGSSQGDGPITNTAVQVSTVGTAGDAQTLPAAAAGILHMVCNRAAANAMDLFPASGDAINKESANTAISLAAGECALCLAFDGVQWGCVIGSAT